MKYKKRARERVLRTTTHVSRQAAARGEMGVGWVGCATSYTGPSSFVQYVESESVPPGFGGIGRPGCAGTPIANGRREQLNLLGGVINTGFYHLSIYLPACTAMEKACVATTPSFNLERQWAARWYDGVDNTTTMFCSVFPCLSHSLSVFFFKL